MFPICTIYPWEYLTPSRLYLPLPSPILPFPLPIDNHWLLLCICEFVSFFVSCICLWYFSDPTHQWYHTVRVFLWLSSLSIKPSMSIPVAANGKILFFFMAEWYSIMCTHLPHLLYPFICGWTFSLLSHLAYWKYHCYEYWGACISSDEWGGFFGIYT